MVHGVIALAIAERRVAEKACLLLSNLILRMRERRRRPVPAKTGSNVSIPQEAFIAALRMGEE